MYYCTKTIIHLKPNFKAIEKQDFLLNSAVFCHPYARMKENKVKEGYKWTFDSLMKAMRRILI